MVCRSLAVPLAGGKLEEGKELQLLLAHGAVLFYSMGYELSIVIVPFLNRAMKGNSTTYATLKVLFSILQFFGGILFGRFGDLFSGKRAMVIAHVASALSYVMMMAANSLVGVFLSMIPSVMQHGFQASQMIVADITLNSSKRSAALGLLGVSYGIADLGLRPVEQGNPRKPRKF